MALSHPRNDSSVIEADDQLHFHPDFAVHALNDADDVGICAARRHEIDQADRAGGGFDFRFEDERVAPIAALGLSDFLFRREKPVPVFFFAEERCKTGRRIKTRKAKPIDRPD